MKQFLFFVFILTLLISCDNSKNSDSGDSENSSTTPIINFSVTHYYPHDTTLYTEGFLFHNGQLFESTGSPNEFPQTKSLIGITDLKTGKFTKKIEIDRKIYFGEGIVFFKNKLYQLTYKNQLGFIYDAITFKKIGQFKYSNLEGWSLTTDGTNLIMSDGTNSLTYFDPVKLIPIKKLNVSEKGLPIDKLNELEYINGFIYANIWMSDIIVKIDPSSGNVVGKLDLKSLTNEAKRINPNSEVLNGIAFDSTADKIYVTGKMWANIYQIEFAH